MQNTYLWTSQESWILEQTVPLASCVILEVKKSLDFSWSSMSNVGGMEGEPWARSALELFVLEICCP